MNEYFLSDSHFGHFNIIRHCERPFVNTKEMDDAIIRNINSVVGVDDILWHLGDWGMCSSYHIESTRQRIRCKNIYLVYGNHDRQIKKKEHLQKLFVQCKEYYCLIRGGYRILLTHRPNITTIPKELVQQSNIHLYGHVHEKSRDWRNMCVEVNNYFPISLCTILERFNNVHIP